MDQKQQLVDLYEQEMEKIRQVKQDIDSLGEMTDEQLLVLVEKAQKFNYVLEKSWTQISGDDMKRKDVRPILLRRDDLRHDFMEIQQIEEQISDLKKDQSEIKNEIKHCRNEKRKEQSKQHHRMILTIVFGVIFLCAVCFHLIMIFRYQRLILPALLVMTILPLVLCIYNGIHLKWALDDVSDSDKEEEELEWSHGEVLQELEDKQAQLQFYDQKYQSVFEELDEYQMAAYPYVEKIIHKLEYREDYRRAKNEYCGIMEILHFRQPDMYMYIPEIFLVEEEMDRFLEAMQEKMANLDEYLVQTLETA